MNKNKKSRPRNYVAEQSQRRGGAGAGRHQNRTYDVAKGRRRNPKHCDKWRKYDE